MDRKPILILASYCGGEDPRCSDTHPCLDCLQMSNIAWAEVSNLTVVGGWEEVDREAVERERDGR